MLVGGGVKENDEAGDAGVLHFRWMLSHRRSSSPSRSV